MDIKLQIKPLSINKAFQGRRYKTKEYDLWLEEGLRLLKAQKIEKTRGDVALDIKFFMKSDRSDIDNPLKTFLDLIVKASLIDDDRVIQAIHLVKIKSKDERIEFEITSI